MITGFKSWETFAVAPRVRGPGRGFFRFITPTYGIAARAFGLSALLIMLPAQLPAQEIPPAAAQETTPPAQEAPPSAAQETPPAAAEATPTPAPEVSSSAAAQEAPPAAAQEAPAPAQEALPPTTQESSAPAAQETAAPVQETPSSVAQEVPPQAAQEVTMPVPQEVTPTTQEAPPLAPAAPEATPPPAEEAVPPPAEPTAPAAPLDPGVVVEKFEFRYGLAHPELPALEQIGRVSVRLARDDGVWRPVKNLIAGEILTLDEVPAGSRFDGTALRLIAQELVRWFNSQDLYGVWVAFSDLESTATGIADRRPGDDRTARLVIWASQVAEVRTLARGKRFKPEFSVNNRKHRTIVTHSPLQPPAAPDQPGSLFKQGVLNQYLQGQSQHPGRLVEASIASAGSPGKVVLDYLINETKSWQVFSQFTNFGTEATGEWRGRVGFQSNQLTNHDDILNIDGITTPDLETYGSFLSYRIPIIRPSLLLARVYGSYGDFLANDASIETLRFVGRNWLAGMEFTNRLSLPRDWQLVSALGANFAHYGIQQQIVSVDGTGNPVSLVTASSDFLIPFVSATVSRQAPWWALSGSLRYEQTVGDFANTNTTNGIPALGRANADSEWSSLRWSLGGSIYLEPLFRGGDADVRFLANEVSFRIRGRLLKEGGNHPEGINGTRLIPHEQEPIGGAFSVRGYPESVLSADEFVIGSIEYAFHFPRVLKPGAAGKFLRDKWAFQWRPKKERQEPDWDLVGRVFYDYAYRQVAPLPLEEGQLESEVGLVEKSLSIAGAGGGLELQIKQNLSIRCDVGLSLTQLRDDTREENERLIVPAGDVRYYFSASFSW